MDANGTLLIVEDERILSGCLERHFSAEGRDVAVANSLAEAQALLRDRTFDAFLLDIGLPDGDGLSLLGTIDVARSIVITADPDPVRLAEAGVRFLLPKPLDLDEVSEVVREIDAAREGEA